jgi:tRNA-Thr(GGU) m(6)t(6)A37 methyltransferase TsaA
MIEAPRFEAVAIGLVSSPFVEKMQAPRQALGVAEVTGEVRLFAGKGYEHALSDLSSFRWIWLLSWLHEARASRSKVLPPRSQRRRGVFATRSPHRPNPIGMSLVELIAVRELVLEVRGLDLLDGTPILDIKPYLPYAEARAEAGHGWIDEAAAPRDPLLKYALEFSPTARVALELLRERFGLELEAPICQVLELGPAPHPYRRIRRAGSGYCLALKDFRVHFTAHERSIVVQSIATGYRPKQLATSDDPALLPHKALAQTRAADRC